MPAFSFVSNPKKGNPYFKSPCPFLVVALSRDSNRRSLWVLRVGWWICPIQWAIFKSVRIALRATGLDVVHRFEQKQSYAVFGEAMSLTTQHYRL